MGSTKPKNYRVLLDTDPQPVESIPPAASLRPGRGKDERYSALQARLALRPGVDHKIAVLPARSKHEHEESRKAASAIRGTLKRYSVKVTERKIGEEIVLFGRYTNGTS